MCILLTKRYVHANGREEIVTELVPCDAGNRRRPCINLRRREETIEVSGASYAGLPALVRSSHDGVSVVSSSMPGTPNSTVHFEIREPQPKGHRRSGSGSSNHRYSKVYLEPAAASRRRPSAAQAPRPVISQPAPPPSRPDRVALPFTIRAPRRPHSDSEYDPAMSGALPPRSPTSPQREGSAGTGSTTVERTDRGRAREEFRRQERERRRREEEQRLLRLQEERDRRLETPAAAAGDERERRERALDEHERRTQAYMRAREEMREEGRRRRDQEEETARRAQLEREAEQAERARRRAHEEERLERERRRRSDEAAAAAAAAAMLAEDEEERERRRRAAEERAARDVDRERLERELQHMIVLEARLEQREREVARAEAATRRALELQAELARLEAHERELREAERQLAREGEERRAARELERREEREHRERQRREREAANYRRAAADLERLERRAREAREQDLERRRLRRRGGVYLDGPRFGERRGITAGPHAAAGAAGNTLDFYIGRLSPGSVDDPERRRARGEAVLVRERMRYAESDTEGYGGTLGRRNTIGGGDRGRETRYRQNRRRYF
jgi:hypothetical protein